VNRERTFRNVIVVAIVACLAGVAVVVDRYGGRTLWPELVGGFLASLLAFMLALTWERERELRRATEAARTVGEQRATEIRRRLEPVRTELEKNEESLFAVQQHLEASSDREFIISNPQLLDGAWAASASRLSELVADFKFIADLSVTYGRLEELRWRLRYRTEHHSVLLDGMTAPLVTQLRGEVEDLLKRVRRQISGPTVQTIGVAVETNLAGSITPRGGLSLKKIRGDDGGG
jgi:hypothetical protein